MGNQYTLWQLLSEQEIAIPLIQRDYAQGRVGKEHIRNAFLTQVEKHLANGENLSLDFVYGNSENGKFHPLDGQQRLTTLWLIHWYIAFKLKKLDDVKNILLKFSYQTRTSSSAFCRALCEKMIDIELGELHIAEYIKKQTWFFSEWIQDPTISAMLRTISGDNNHDTIDCIEDIFNSKHYQAYWENLTQKNTITFELMVIGTEKLPISDDLYIKMNARGKKLTDFENFKADWVSYVQEDPEFLEYNGSETFAQYFPKQIDNKWTDVFWNNRKNDVSFDGNIDKAFFSFVNRFVLNQHCLLSTVPASYYNSGKHIPTDDDTKLIQRHFDILYGTGLGKKGTNDDSLIEYKGFDVYKQHLTLCNLKQMDIIFSNLFNAPLKITDLNFSGVEEESEFDEASNQNRSYYFLPQYTNDGKLISTGLKERIYFHAICLFLINPKWNKLNDWKRIVWNLTENAAIDNIEAMITCLRFIDGLGMYLSSNDWEVYENLSKYSSNVSGRLGAQWKEEKEKARKIYEDASMKSIIEAAESHAFFKGTIRFLFTGPDGQPDWNSFADKFDNTRQLFSNKEKVSAETIKSFLGTFEAFADLEFVSEQKSYFFTTIGDHPRYNCWKRGILCNESLHKQVHAFLTKQPFVAKDTYLDFINSGAVEAISQKGDNDKFRYHWSRNWAVHRDYTTHGIYVTNTRLKNNKFIKALHDSGKIKLSDDHVFYNDFIWGMEVIFTYQGNEYCWTIDWDGKNQINSVSSQQNCFEWTELMDSTQWLLELDKLNSI